MQSLKFNRLLVLSNTQKLANQFVFSKTKNLITADDNSVGKSTLVKLLFWGVGCEPSFDSTWKAMDCQTLVEFELGKNIYSIKRHKNFVSLKVNNGTYQKFEKITGDFSKAMADIFGFKARLKSYSDELEVPPPAYYFLPFYIDQKRSWGTAWDNFENLTQYSSWKPTIIKYHVGLLTPEYFELEKDKFDKKDEQKDFEVQIGKIETALEIVEDYIPKSTIASLNTPELAIMSDEIKQDLKFLQTQQEQLLSELSYCQSEVVYIEQQKIITENIIKELDKDYQFTVENIENDEIECPLCGVIHENTIINRASILTDKAQAENQLLTLNESFAKIQKRLEKANNDLKIAEGSINEINAKYTANEATNKIMNTSDIIESIAGNNIKHKANRDKETKVISVDKLKTEIKNIKKEQKKLLTKEEIENINKDFLLILKRYIEALEAEAVNLSEINTPLDYNKIVKEGGAAEGSRAILAYYLTIFKMVELYGNEVKSSLVIDTPNQQEQSHTNYDNIVKLITKEIDKNSQVILCAMENEHLKDFSKGAKIFRLDENKLLSSDSYQKIKKEFD